MLLGEVNDFGIGSSEVTRQFMDEEPSQLGVVINHILHYVIGSVPTTDGSKAAADELYGSLAKYAL